MNRSAGHFRGQRRRDFGPVQAALAESLRELIEQAHMERDQLGTAVRFRLNQKIVPRPEKRISDLVTGARFPTFAEVDAIVQLCTTTSTREKQRNRFKDLFAAAAEERKEISRSGLEGREEVVVIPAPRSGQMPSMTAADLRQGANAVDAISPNSVDPLPSGDARTSDVLSGVRWVGAPLSGKLRDSWYWLALLVIAAVTISLVVALLPSRAAAIMATGDVSLVREDGQPRLIFPIASGGISYCTRTDDGGWSHPWGNETSDVQWSGISRSTTFYSDFGGFEVLGSKSGVLTFGYRDNGFPSGLIRWHDPLPVIDDRTGDPVREVSGRPGFFQYQMEPPTGPEFFALVPVESGGLDVYKRDGASRKWHLEGIIASSLGRIDSVSVNYVSDSGANVILRVGAKLYAVSRLSTGILEQSAGGWTEPKELAIAGGVHLDVVGDPALISTGAGADGADLRLAVPVRGGLVLLTARDGVAGTWLSETVTGVTQPDSVAILEGSQDGQANTYVAYRIGKTLFGTWRADAEQIWHAPTQITC